MGLKTRMYVRRMSRCCGAVVETSNYIARASGRLMRDVYDAYTAQMSSGAVASVTDRMSKFWGTWATRLGFKRRVVVRRRKRNARHLASLEQELETLKLQLSVLSAPAQAHSYPGCPTTHSPSETAPGRLPKPVTPPRYARPPAPGSRRRAGPPSAAKVQLRPVQAPVDEYGA
ncbi:hypothetical protein DIPPA_16599 [Diplonema papillatum]|nr:hypothetical protein DIPPA_16599 [Diplonema papillatum]